MLLSKPRKNRAGPGEVCVALVEFDSVENCEKAFEGLSDLEIGGMACKAQLGGEKVNVSFFHTSIALPTAFKLISLFESITQNGFTTRGPY